MSKEYVLVQFESDWSDEFDVYGSEVMTKEKYERYINDLTEKWKDGITVECYFGTNEGFTWDNISDYIDCLTVKDISEEEYNIIKRLFGKHYGHNPDPLERLEDEEE